MQIFSWKTLEKTAYLLNKKIANEMIGQMPYKYNDLINDYPGIRLEK